jgi:hypothetical protein
MKISTMKTKGVAVQTIIMIMLGVVVLLFVGYWLVRVFTGKGLSAQECRSQYIEWCQSCAARNWVGTAAWSPDMVTCLGLYAQTIGLTTPLGANGDCANLVNKNNCIAVGIGGV